MAFRKLPHRQERLRQSRLLLDLARVSHDAIYGTQDLGTSLDGVFIVACIVIGHAENRVMNVSKLSHYLGMTRQTISRRLDELIDLGVVERAGQYYYLTPNFDRSTHRARSNNLLVSAFREMQRHESLG